MYFHIECASWANSGSAVGEGKTIDAWLYREADRILAAYGNHPSFLLMAYGNEPAGPPGKGEEYLGRLGRALQGQGPAPALYVRGAAGR